MVRASAPDLPVAVPQRLWRPCPECPPLLLLWCLLLWLRSLSLSLSYERDLSLSLRSRCPIPRSCLCFFKETSNEPRSLSRSLSRSRSTLTGVRDLERERFLLCPEPPPPLMLWRPLSLESLLLWWLDLDLRGGTRGEC